MNETAADGRRQIDEFTSTPKQRSLTTHTAEAMFRVHESVRQMRGDLFLVSGLLETETMRSGTLKIDGGAIAAELRDLAALAESLGHRRLPAGAEEYLGKPCPLCKAEVVSVEQGRGSDLVLICKAGHHALQKYEA